MTYKRILSIGLLLLLAFTVAACGPSNDGLASDYDSLVEKLQSAGAAVEEGDELLQPFFSVPAKVIKVNGSDVQVFEYAEAASADEEAAQVSADGFSIGTTMLSWMDTPHFYKSGKLIVLYVGSDAEVLTTLEQALGPQFAGG